LLSTIEFPFADSFLQECAMKPQMMTELYQYNSWANLRQLQAAEKLSADQFVKTLGSSFSSVRDTMAHIYGAEGVWLARFQGHSPSAFPNAADYPGLAHLHKEWREQDVRLLEFVRGLRQEDLDRVMEYKTMKFGVYNNPMWQSLLHVVNHGTYHRGQITTMLRQLSAEPILTDLMHFYRQHSDASA
jgi:uncharacterized damage-inducible protein DinB